MVTCRIHNLSVITTHLSHDFGFVFDEHLPSTDW